MRLSDISLNMMWEKQRTFSHRRRVKRLSSIPLYQLEAPSSLAPQPEDGPSAVNSFSLAPPDLRGSCWRAKLKINPPMGYVFSRKIAVNTFE